LRVGAVGAPIFIGRTFGCRLFDATGGALFGLLSAVCLSAGGAPGFFSAGLFAADLLTAELLAAVLPEPELFAWRELGAGAPAPFAVDCGLDATEFGVTEFGAGLATPAPETVPDAFPGWLPEILAVALAACVFAYQKYDPAPPAITTAPNAIRIILVLPNRLRSAAFAESNWFPKSGAAPKSDITVSPCDAKPLARLESAARPDEGASDGFGALFQSVNVSACAPLCARFRGCTIISSAPSTIDSAKETGAGSLEILCWRDSLRAALCGIAGEAAGVSGIVLVVEFIGALAGGATFRLIGGIAAFCAGGATTTGGVFISRFVS
jgi:hypothetical protein